MKRNLAIAAGVLGFHGVMLWALQTGLLYRAVEVLVPAQLLSEFTEPPKPKPTPPPEAPARPKAQPTAHPVQPSAPPPPLPVAAVDAPPSVNAPTGSTQSQTVVAQATAAPTAAPARAAPAPAPLVELPLSRADYLQNPSPAYPAISKRLGEQGKVLLSVFISVDGQPLKAEIKQSSGYDRLDQVALNTVLKWRFVPGRRGGVPEAMGVTVPINFVLE